MRSGVRRTLDLLLAGLSHYRFPPRARDILCTAVLAMAEMSIRLSVKRVNCDKRKGISAKILILYKRSIYLVFRHEKWLMNDDLLIVPEILGQTDPVPSKKSIFNRFSLVAPQP